MIKKIIQKAIPLLQVFLLLLFISSMNISCSSKKNKAASSSNDDEYVVKRNGINEDENKEDNTNDRTSILNITKPTTFKTSNIYYQAYGNDDEKYKKVDEWLFTFYTDGTCEYYYNGTKWTYLQGTSKSVPATPEKTYQGQWQLWERSIKDEPFRAIIVTESPYKYLCFTEGGSYLTMNGNEISRKGVNDIDDLLLSFYTKEQRNKEEQNSKNSRIYSIFTVVK